MAKELEPCPFCPPDKSDPCAFVEPDGYQEHAGNVYRGSVGCKHCGIGLELFMTDSEIPGEWFEDSPEDEPKGFLEYLENLWNTRHERTCHLKNDGGYLRDRCSECGEAFRVYAEVVPGSASPRIPNSALAAERR